MAGVNKVILVGNLGADPEARSLNNGGEVVNLRVATSETWKDKDGNRQERTEWHQVVIFNENLGRVAKSYLRKGSKVYLEGQIQTRKWQDQSGNDKYTTEIVLQRFRGELVLLDARGEGGGSGGGLRRRRLRRRLRRRSSSGGSQRQQRPQPAAFDTRPRRRRSLLGWLGRHRFSLASAAKGPASASVSTPASLSAASSPRAARIGIETKRQGVGDRASEIDRRSVVEDHVAIRFRPIRFPHRRCRPWIRAGSRCRRASSTCASTGSPVTTQLWQRLALSGLGADHLAFPLERRMRLQPVERLQV